MQAKRGLHGAELLHPSQMYQLFDNFWLQRTPVTLVEAFSLFAPIPAGEPTGIRAHLPERYVAAKFYGNAALPPTPENREFVTSYLTDLAQQSTSCCSTPAQRFDDHSDFPPSLRGRLHTIDHLMAPETNLAVQTEVIRNAQAFVGTYGGFSYLAPLCGVNTLAFYSHAGGFRFDHLEVAKRVFSALKCGTFTEVDLRAAEALRLGFGGVRPDRRGQTTMRARPDEPGLDAAANLARSRGAPRLCARTLARQGGVGRRVRRTDAAACGMRAVARTRPQPRRNAYKAVRRPRCGPRRDARPTCRSAGGSTGPSGASSARSSGCLARPPARRRTVALGSRVRDALLGAVPPLAEDGVPRRSQRASSPCRAAASASWYEGVAGRYVEMWDDMEPAEFARRNAARGVTKHYERSAARRGDPGVGGAARWARAISTCCTRA